MPEAEDPNVKHEREQKQLLLRVEVAKRVSESEFAEMVTGERWFEDKVTLLKARAAELFKQGFLEMAAAAYTRAIGLHAIKGEAASHALYGNRSACRCGFGDYEGALADAEECIRLSPSWPKGYVRQGAALHGLYRLEEAVKAYELGLTFDPHLAALTEGLKDALRRRQSLGGQWEVVFERSSAQTTKTESAQDAQSDGHLLLAPGARLSAEGEPCRTLLVVVDAHVHLLDVQRGELLRRWPASDVVAACAHRSGTDRSLYVAQAGPTSNGLRTLSLDDAPDDADANNSNNNDNNNQQPAVSRTSDELGIGQPRGVAFVPSTPHAEMAQPTLLVCDSANGRVLALDPAALTQRRAYGGRGSGDGELGTPVSLSAHDDLIAVADAAHYRVTLFRAADGTFVRHLGEQASKFATAPRAGVFARPPAHVALAEGHLFVIESGGVHVHVLDPHSAEPKGLLTPPFNARPPLTERACMTHDRPLGETAREALKAARTADTGCLTGLCVSDDDLYVSTNHGDRPKILRLPRTQPPPAAAADQASREPPPKKELAYKKGFLLDVS